MEEEDEDLEDFAADFGKSKFSESVSSDEASDEDAADRKAKKRPLKVYRGPSKKGFTGVDDVASKKKRRAHVEVRDLAQEHLSPSWIVASHSSRRLMKLALLTSQSAGVQCHLTDLCKLFCRSSMRTSTSLLGQQKHSRFGEPARLPSLACHFGRG